MLRVSANVTERDIDISLINGEVNEGSGLEYAAELVQLAEAVAAWDEAAISEARQRLLEAAGPQVLVDAAGVAGNFQRMVRIADSMGIPVDNMSNEISNQVREELDLYRFHSAENSPRTGSEL
jgi:coenzyme F420-reducing hydrogenase gamma subunit